MNTQQAYNTWASQYDTNENKTRDLEAQSLRESLKDISFDRCLEIGCGTGKNTAWLITQAKHVTAVDFSEEMLSKAKEKITAGNVNFMQADITAEWNFGNGNYDLVTFSLVLEHIEDLNHIFEQAADVLNPGAHVYIGELHPVKQYMGSKARFETAEGLQIVKCFNHHVSDFVHAGKKNGLMIVDIDEYFDDDNREQVPRIITMLMRKVPHPGH
ncbi:MAG: class I SAM-dependent methyltransferase [Chitinophagaceae bacterium]